MTNAPIDPGVRIGHVHLKVADLDRALNFYCGVLGFELTQRVGAAGGVHFRRRLSSSHRSQHLGERAAARRRRRAAPASTTSPSFIRPARNLPTRCAG